MKVSQTFYLHRNQPTNQAKGITSSALIGTDSKDPNLKNNPNTGDTVPTQRKKNTNWGFCPFSDSARSHIEITTM